MAVEVHRTCTHAHLTAAVLGGVWIRDFVTSRSAAAGRKHENCRTGTIVALRLPLCREQRALE
jgi:hypothetical protein